MRVFPQRAALFVLLLLVVLGPVVLVNAREPDLPSGQARVTVMSFNVRYDEPADELSWSDRLPAIEQMIAKREPAIIGFQEPLAHQVEQLAAALDDYTWVGVGTADGERAGNFTPLFFRDDLFDLERHGTFWLSDTPETPSRGWDGALPRVVTWAELRPASGGPAITVFNTHFDHVGRTARARSAQLLAERIKALAPAGPVVVTGDLNTIGIDPALSPLTDQFDDARTSAPVTDLVGSFNHWRSGLGLVSIDFVLSRDAQAARFETVNDDYGINYLSDHFPIVATFHIPS